MTTSNEQHKLDLILGAKHHDPFSFLGLHAVAKTYVFRAFFPYAEIVSIETKTGWELLERTHSDGFFSWTGNTAPPLPCKLKIEQQGNAFEIVDAYSFAPILSDDELHLFAVGRLKEAYNSFGAHVCTHQGIQGVRFAVWAPGAERVSVVGPYNQIGRAHV